MKRNIYTPTGISKFLYTTLFFLLVTIGQLSAQGRVSVELTDPDTKSLRNKMSKSASGLFTELNNAFTQNRLPNFSHIDMTYESQQNLMRIWMFAPCYITESEIITRCLTTTTGYQIRYIPAKGKNRDVLRDFVVHFDKDGKINDVYFAIDNHTYMSVIKANKSIKDLRRRQLMMFAIEKLRTAYICRDVRLTETFSFKNDDNMNLVYDRKTQRYEATSGRVYMSELTRGFYTRDWDMDITFKDIYIVEHPENSNVYGMTIRQVWSDTDATDDGWLFFAVEFVSETKMLVHVASWQPYEIDGVVFPREDVLQIGELEF